MTVILTLSGAKGKDPSNWRTSLLLGVQGSFAALRMTVVCVCLVAATVHAQTPDPVFARARQLVANGNGAAGRLLIDSMITATGPDSPVYAEALYWRAALAATSADAEHDYRRLVVEFPFSAHSAEALLQLAQLESARGDRAAAAIHLDRFLLDNPKSKERPRAMLLLVRLLFEQNDFPRGCTMLRRSLNEIPAESVEMRNQLEYYSPRCAAADVGAGGRVPAPPPTDPAAPVASPVATLVATPRDSIKRDAVKRDTIVAEKEAKGRFTLQVAAYKTKPEADALAKKLKARKLDVRVVGVGKLYRVRVGRYATRAQAISAQKELKAKKIDAFITEIGADDK